MLGLEDPAYEVAAYDISRNLQLNPLHPVAATLIGFIGASLESVRLQLVREHQRRKQEREFQDLAKEAARIAELLNEDLQQQRERLEDISAMRRREGAVARAGQSPSGEDPTTFVEGDDEPGLLDVPQPPKVAEAEPHGAEPPDLVRSPSPETSGEDRVKASGGTGPSRRGSGGLRVEYRNLGADDDRGRYDGLEKLILINLDHPMIEAARQLGG